MSGASLEVTGTGTDQHLILADDALAAAPADTAVRVHDNGAALHKDLDEALIQCAVSRPHGWPEPPGSAHGRKSSFLLQSAAPTRRSSIRPLLQEPRNASSMLDAAEPLWPELHHPQNPGRCYDRLDFRQVKGILSCVNRIRIALEIQPSAHGLLPLSIPGRSHRPQRWLSWHRPLPPELHRTIRSLTLKVLCAVTGELHNLVVHAVGADLADDGEH